MYFSRPMRFERDEERTVSPRFLLFLDDNGEKTSFHASSVALSHLYSLPSTVPFTLAISTSCAAYSPTYSSKG